MAPTLQPPAAICRARSAIDGLGAMFKIADPAAWNSMARPTPSQLASLLYSIGGALDEGLSDLGFDPPAV